MAPGNLAQLSIDIHLEWEYPSDYVLERYKPMVLKSVRKGIENRWTAFWQECSGK